ncbi:MAG: molecular chaperone HtpG [Lewinellaceae bacterium]|nr:molecular chaperone HtpG [Lewinellaceae bacterium]
MQRGSISVQTENIFPIIKKFLYSDHEIFLRELVSNAVDATVKLQTLARRGEFSGELGETTIDILLDKEAKTLTIRDRGIGMSEDEVQKYLNQVAFSSAAEFLEKYKDDANIIGHFGLGFYSAFMVARKVEVITHSYRPDSQGVTWSCEGNPEYTITENDKADRGTDIILHIAEDSLEFLEQERIEGLLEKYCKFLPVAIRFGKKSESVTEGEGEEAKTTTVEVDNIINNPAPAWKKAPTDLTDEDYRAFYRELYPYSFEAPLFWIHLNIDYPFNLTGILYFPHLGNGLELQRNKIQLYSNQVYVTDNVKDIVPEFLTLLHGVIDSPDIPLNVSRSYLQSDGNVKKITSHITKKVADKLAELFKNDREGFQEKWNDLGVFVKYGMLSDEKFHDRALPFALVKNTRNEYEPIEAYIEKVKAAQTDKHNKVVLLYANQEEQQYSQIQACVNTGYDVLLMDQVIDNHYMQHLEYKLGNITFVRVDSDTVDNLVQKDEKKESVLSEEQEKQVNEWFSAVTTGGHVQLKPLSPNDMPVTITRPEFMRRMKEMQAMQGVRMDQFPETFNVVVNTNHPLIAQRLFQETDAEQRQTTIQYLYQLAMLESGMLKGADLNAFVQRSLGNI